MLVFVDCQLGGASQDPDHAQGSKGLKVLAADDVQELYRPLPWRSGGCGGCGEGLQRDGQGGAGLLGAGAL